MHPLLVSIFGAIGAVLSGIALWLIWNRSIDATATGRAIAATAVSWVVAMFAGWISADVAQGLIPSLSRRSSAIIGLVVGAISYGASMVILLRRTGANRFRFATALSAGLLQIVIVVGILTALSFTIYWLFGG